MFDLSHGIQMLSVQIVPFIMAVVFHEFAHGFVALKWGDTTARDQGRLTLNPVPHIDPLGTLILPILMMVTGLNLLFGWAKPVPIDPVRFKKYRPGLFWVSIAGPGMNVILAIISALLFVSIHLFVPQSQFFHEPLSMMSAVSIQLNFALAIFNMIPLPPLDGSKVVLSFLDYESARKYEAIGQYSTFILLALLWTGALSILSGPIQFLNQVTVAGAFWFFQAMGANV